MIILIGIFAKKILDIALYLLVPKKKKKRILTCIIRFIIVKKNTDVLHVYYR